VVVAHQHLVDDAVGVGGVQVQPAPCRVLVHGLLKMFENGEEHKRREGQPWYDFSGLKASLGIKF